MASKIETLKANLEAVLGERIVELIEHVGELTLVVKPEHYREVARTLRDDRTLGFEQLIDLCGVDYQTYGDGTYYDDGNAGRPRFAVAVQLLSLSNNWRLRVRSYASDDDLPIVPSMVEIWTSANWYEREAFDLFGIVFEGHPDLRRILTDYGFIGYPFRKDFPISGYVEMRYDPQEKRVVYQPVTIEPREITPRVIREESFGGLKY